MYEHCNCLINFDKLYVTVGDLISLYFFIFRFVQSALLFLYSRAVGETLVGTGEITMNGRIFF